MNQHERRWLRPSTSGHDADPGLKHTTVRWHTGPNGAGDPTTGWYILTHENDHEAKVAARTGPIRTNNLDRRLFKLHGANLDGSDLLTQASDQRNDRVNRIIEEGHVQRLHKAASRWNLESRESLGDDNAKGIGVPETRFHWQFSPDAICKHDALGRTFEELRSAAAALEGWTES